MSNRPCVMISKAEQIQLLEPGRTTGDQTGCNDLLSQTVDGDRMKTSMDDVFPTAYQLLRRG